MKPKRDPKTSWQLIRDIQKSRIEEDLPPVGSANLAPFGNDQSKMREGRKSLPIKQAGKDHSSTQRPLLLLSALVCLSFFQIAPLPFSLKLLNLAAIIAVCVYLIFLARRSSPPDENNQPDTRTEQTEEIERLQDLTWELREREERYRSMADAFGDMSMDRTNEGLIVYLNPTFARFLNVDASTLIGKKFPMEMEVVEFAEGDSGTEKVSIVKLKVDQKERWLAWLDIPIRNERSNLNLVRTVARDVTPQKLVERDLRTATDKAQSASKAKTQFLANVSHEMRTPLNGILGMSGLLADSNLSSEQITYVDAIHDSGKALLTLIEDILDMTLVEAGKLEIRNAPMDPLRLIEDVCELLSSRAHLKNISIGSHVSDRVPPLVASDAGRLRQILINLIGNAIKFTERGGVYVECDLDSDEAGDVYLEIKVHDTGPGIGKDDQYAVFEEFSQADSESTRKHGGAGLGLSISKRIVEEMGGNIALKSEVGVGSVFSFRLPVTVNPDPALQAEPKNMTGINITLVTNDPITERVIRNNLLESRSKFRVLDPIEGFNKANREDGILFYDADNSNAGCNVSGLTESVRKIVLLKPEERSKLQGYLESGFDGYLIKPIRRSSLMNMLYGQKKHETEDERKVSSSRQWASGIRTNGKSKSVLLAEDNEINALLARSILEKAGHAVTRAKNGQETLALLEERMDNDPFDLLLLDLQMPVMDGIEALRIIRSGEVKPGEKPLPVYILTADEQEESRSVAFDEGATGFLTKPLDPGKLLGLLDDIEVSS